MYVSSRLSQKSMSNYTFCLIIVSGPTVEHYFMTLLQIIPKCDLRFCFEAKNVLLKKQKKTKKNKNAHAIIIEFWQRGWQLTDLISQTVLSSKVIPYKLSLYDIFFLGKSRYALAVLIP